MLDRAPAERLVSATYWADPKGGVVDQTERDLGLRGLAHGPADDLAGVHVENGGEVGPAIAGWDVGEVGEPYLIGAAASKLRASLSGTIG
tara:strand:- start:1042 stop:1311 length:270 start_codon:yes stop_codon:yes gene_type:complete